MVAGVADRVLVMYAGKPVEIGTVDEVFYNPRMPYTLGLLGSLPRLDVDEELLTPIQGAPPSLVNLPPGCPFSPRCPLVADVCLEVEPELTVTSSADHLAACHRWTELEGRGGRRPTSSMPRPPTRSPSREHRSLRGAALPDAFAPATTCRVPTNRASTARRPTTSRRSRCPSSRPA